MERRVKLTEDGLEKFLKGIKDLNRNFDSDLSQIELSAELGVNKRTLEKIITQVPTYLSPLSRAFKRVVRSKPAEGADADYEKVPDDPSPKPQRSKRPVQSTPLSNPALGKLSPSVPSLNPYFTDRKNVVTPDREDVDLLEVVHDALKTYKTVALTGMAGIGKTVTAVAYAHRYRRAYKGIYWVVSEGLDAFKTGLVGLAKQLMSSVPVDGDQEKTFQAVKNWFEEYSGWLLILDNVDDLDVLAPHFPRNDNGRFLLTTRVQATAIPDENIPISPFRPEEGATLLLRRARQIKKHQTVKDATTEEQEAAMAINELLDGFPLALSQVGAFILETQCSVTEYQSYQSQQGIALTDDYADPSHECVSKTVQDSINQIEAKSKTGPAAAELVCLCAFLAPDVIPEEIFTTGKLTLTGFSQPLTERDYLRVRAAAIKYSLIGRDQKRKALSIHSLVQDVIKQAMKPEEQYDWVVRVVCVIHDASPEPEFANWPLCERLLPHWRRCAEHIDAFAINTAEASELLDKAGYFLYQHFQIAESKTLFVKSLAIKEQIYGPDEIKTAFGYSNLGALHSELGNHAEAEQLYLKTLAIREAKLEPEHPDMATALHNLAGLYNYQGRYADAERLFNRALIIRERELGTNLVLTLNGLAVAKHRQGNYADAVLVYQRALDIGEVRLGAEHPDMPRTLINLAMCYSNLERYGDASPLLRRALAILERLIEEKRLEAMHPEKAGAMGQMAIVQWKQGQVQEAKEMFQDALHIFETVFGNPHPATRYLSQKYAEFQKDTGLN